MGRVHVKNEAIKPETPIHFNCIGMLDPTSNTALTEKHFSCLNCIKKWN